MRIVHVSDCFAPMMGGIETQVLQLATKQAEAGHDVLVLTCTPAGEFDDAALPFAVARSVWPNPASLPIDPRGPHRFLRAIRAWRPDVVHLHQGELTPVVQGLIWHLRGGEFPAVVTVHSVWNQRITVPLYRAAAQAAGLRQSPIFWTGVSQLVAGRLAEVYGGSNVAVLPNGVDSAAWRTTPEPHEGPDRRSGLVAATASRFAPRKRIPALLRIIERVIADTGGPDPTRLRVVLAGQGPGWESARRFVEERGLAGVVELPGRLSADELRDVYARADVFLSPSVNEAASIAAAEAQAAGLAILSRSQSGLGERISPVEGAVADTDDEFARVLTSWVDDPALVEPMRAHNRDTLCPLDWSLTLPQADRMYELARARARAEG